MTPSSTMIGRLWNRSQAGKSFLMQTKVFGIGFHKTATTSLAKALSYLGYRVTGPNWVYDPNPAEKVYKMAFELANKVRCLSRQSLAYSLQGIGSEISR